VIVDTGVFVAAANRDDPDHEACRTLLEGLTGTAVVPALVVAEAGYLIARELGQIVEASFLRSLTSDRDRLEAPNVGDLIRAAELVETYADLGLGVTDATVIALAERLDETDIATLDHRHFSVVRPHHTESFALHP
jgi:predicted nucleic acid-binding protein